MTCSPGDITAIPFPYSYGTLKPSIFQNILESLCGYLGCSQWERRTRNEELRTDERRPMTDDGTD